MSSQHWNVLFPESAYFALKCNLDLEIHNKKVFTLEQQKFFSGNKILNSTLFNMNSVMIKVWVKADAANGFQKIYEESYSWYIEYFAVIHQFMRVQYSKAQSYICEKYDAFSTQKFVSSYMF